MKAVTVKESDQSVTHKFSPEQLGLIKSIICKGASDDELRLFLYHCQRTGLDPLARQIYSIERRESSAGQWVKKRSIQVSIDGFRLIAERSKKYAGQTGPFWCGEDGEWQDVWLGKTPPLAAKVGVLRTDFKEPCWGVARFDAYAQMKDGKPTRMWAQMPDVMIAKCAEALALRKAFPQELSGLYTSDEMEQAGPVVEITPSDAQGRPPAQVEPPKDTQEAKPSSLDRDRALVLFKQIKADLKNAPSLATVDNIILERGADLAFIKSIEPDRGYTKLMQLADHRRDELMQPQEAEP